MRNFFFTFLFLFSFLLSFSQDFNGYRSGNYTGVNGVFFNPANIADSRYRWDFNLFNLSASFGNNKASYSLKDLGNAINADSIKNQVFSDKAGPTSGLVSFVMNGPSILFNLNKKSSIALSTRARAMVNITDIDGKLANQLINDANNGSDLPYTIASSQNTVFNINGWTEFGLSYARVLHDDGPNFFKGGITVKYLAGAANAYLNLDKLNTTIDNDAVLDETYLTNASGKIGLGFGGINTSDFSASDLFKFKSTGFGGDIGFVYEYRPDSNNTKISETGEYRRDLNKYKFRFGLAILDLGSISYKRDLTRSEAYSIHIPNGQRFYLSSLDGLDNFKDTLDQYPQFFTPDTNAGSSSYNVSLPTTLQIDADYHLHKSFYISLAAQLALTKNSSKAYNSQYFNAVALTPRYEGRAFGLYLPLTYSSLTSFNAGLSLRFGPLFLGSGSVLSALLGNSKQADFHFGLRFGGLQKNKEKKYRKKAQADNEE
ncbi:MAG TPA: DUF5723 family protein [Chitinophagaceae bacterium]|nr:DUF5723 family protein [Chitinophagaceae bacterium]